MLLATLGKILVVLAIGGGGGFATYHFTKRVNGLEDYPSSPYSESGELRMPCTTPFVMKTDQGVTIFVMSEEQGRTFLNRDYKGEGKVEKCPSYKEPE